MVAAKMAVEDFLASPHKLKRPIEVISGDHMNKADAGANIAREWIDRDGVDVVIDVPNSAVALAVRNVVQQKNRVLLVSGASSSDLTGKSCSPNLVAWTYDTYALSSGINRPHILRGSSCLGLPDALRRQTLDQSSVLDTETAAIHIGHHEVRA